MVQRYLPTAGREAGASEGSVFFRLWSWVRGGLCWLYKALHLDRLFSGSVFLQTWFWCALPVVLAPVLCKFSPSVLVLGLALIGYASLLLVLVRDKNHALAGAPTNRYVVLYAAVYLAGTLFCISLVRSALQAVHYTVWRTDTQLGSRGGLVRRYEMRLRLCQLNYADLRRSPATWALHYCPVFVSAGACRPELPLFVWREGTPLLRELLPEMAQLPPDTRADTTDRSVVFFLPAGIPLALCLLLTAVSRTTLPALTLPLLIPTGVFAALLGAAAVGWHREGVWQQQGQLLLCRQHRFHLHQLCVFHPDTGFTALQSPWAVTVQRANLTLVFPGKEKVTVRSVPLAALDFLEI